MGGRTVASLASRWPSAPTRLVLTLLVWLAFVQPTLPAANANLDPSWGAVQALILGGGAQCGVDTVFTFGPLGWFHEPTYVPSLFALHVAWEFGLKLALAALVVAVSSRFARGVDLALALAAASCAGAGLDGLALVGIFANAVWIGQRVERPIALSIAAFVPSVALALVKFPYFLEFCVATLALTCAFWISGARRSFTFLAGSVALCVGSWSLVGQSPAHLPAWFLSSLEIARGYGGALGLETSAATVALALFVLAACAFALRFAVRAHGDRMAVAWILFFAFTAWIGFKNGFVRGQFKPIMAFDFAAVGMFLLPLDGFRSSRTARVLRRAACSAALMGHALVLVPGWGAPRALLHEVADRIGTGAAFVCRPGAWRAGLEADLETKRGEGSLPLVRERVGSDAIDVFGWSQGIAFLNGLHYTPRPIFQSYAACTPALQEANERFLSSERAPPWVLFGPTGVDGHLPSIEDAGAFAAISRLYRLELEERGYMLLRRIEPRDRAHDVGTAVVSKVSRIGDRIEFARQLPARGEPPRVLTLSLALRLSLLGRLQSALLKSPPVALEVEDARGRRRVFRIAPGYVERGFVVSPLLDTPERFRGWFHGEMELATRSARVLVRDEDRWAFDDDFRFELRRVDWLSPPIDPEYATRRLAAIVRPEPAAIVTVAGHEIVRLRESTEALVVGTPSSIRFDLEPGRYTLVAYCGLHPRLADPGASGDAAFRIVVRRGPGTEQEIDRRIVTSTGRIAVTRMTSTIELTRGDSVLLRAERADPLGLEAANAYWALVTLTRDP